MQGTQEAAADVFRPSAVDDEGYLLERRAAIVVTMPDDGLASFFMPVLAKALRKFADAIDRGAAGNDSRERHDIEIDDGFGFSQGIVSVEIVSLDDVVFLDGGDDVDGDDLESSQPSEEELSEFQSLLSAEEVAAIREQ